MSMRESQKIGNKRYQDSKCIRISLILNKEMGEVLIKHITKNSNTKNGFIIQAIKEKIERETNKNFDELLKELQPAEENETAKSAEASATEKGEE